jgi:hypothetical protein
MVVLFMIAIGLASLRWVMEGHDEKSGRTVVPIYRKCHFIFKMKCVAITVTKNIKEKYFRRELKNNWKGRR